MRRILLLTLFLAACNKGDPIDTDVDPICTDADGDGFCAEIDDCDDSVDTTYPGALDPPYDSIDRNCDGADPTDFDGDGYDGPNGVGPDCNDGNPEIHPEAFEECYLDIDANCDGSVNLDDCDEDGWTRHEDCDDREATTYPGAADAWYDGVDSNCDRADDYDQDADGDRDDNHGGGDCDDLDPTIATNAYELWNDIDETCDGLHVLVNVDSWKHYDGALSDRAWTTAVAIVGDVDNDGLPDVFATDVLRTADNDGGAYVIATGQEDGRTDDVQVGRVTGADGELFGWSADTIGDIDGDGLIDLVVGAPLHDFDGSDYYNPKGGAAIVFLGSQLANGGNISSLQGFATFEPTYLAGLSVAGLGDLDGDGHEELAAGTNFLGPMAVGIYSGAQVAAGGDFDSTSTLATVFEGSFMYGGGLLGRVDFDGDGDIDVVAGRTAPSFFCYGNCAARPAVAIVPAEDILAGSQVSFGSVPNILGNADSGFGGFISSLDDVDRDGYAELVVADPTATGADGNANGGAVYVIDGDDFADGADGPAISSFTVTGEVGGAFIRVSPRNGDPTRDGKDELFVGEPGNFDVYSVVTQLFPTYGDGFVRVFDGDTVAAGGSVTTGQAETTFTPDVGNGTFGMSYDVGDMDGDGTVDIAIGAPIYGYGKLFLYRSAYP